MSAPSCNCGACKFGYSCKSYSAWRSAPPGRPPLDVRGLTPFLELRELRHELRLSSLRGAQTTTKLRRSGCIAASAASRGSSAPGEVRLARFMAVLELLGTAPWASKRFEVNEKILRRMVASHMTLIVGGANVRPELYSLLEQCVTSTPMLRPRHLSDALCLQVRGLVGLAEPSLGHKQVRYLEPACGFGGLTQCTAGSRARRRR